MIQSVQLPAPANWQDFEYLCLRLLSDILDNPQVQRNGRQGQSQHGVDVSGRSGDKWIGIQCKGKTANYGGVLTEEELKAELAKSETFTPKLSSFCLATTAPRDQAIQKVARDLTEASGYEEVSVWAWDDIQEMLYQRQHLLPHLYPQFYRFSGEGKQAVELIEIFIPEADKICRVADLEERYQTDPLDIQKGWVSFFERLVRLPRQVRETLYVMIRNSDPYDADPSQSVCLWGEARMFSGLNEDEFAEHVLILNYRGFLRVWERYGFEPQTINLLTFDDNNHNNIFTPLLENLSELELSRLIIERELSLLTEEIE